MLPVMFMISWAIQIKIIFMMKCRVLHVNNVTLHAKRKIEECAV